MRRTPTWAAVTAVLVGLAAVLGGVRLLGFERPAPPVTVVRVVDGDTVDVRGPAGRERIRLLGVNTPETHDPDRPVECFGPEAEAFTRRVLTGRIVTLEDDVETRDRFGRRLAYVLVDGRRFNDLLLRLGYARLLIVPPNGTHRREMLREEMDARRSGRGLWARCG
jgi:micrococcal nuclease